MVLVPLAVNPDTPDDPVAVQAKVAPLTLEVSVTSVVLLPEQMVCDNGVLVTIGVGLTVTVYVNTVPAQPFAEGVIRYTTLTAAEVVLINASVIGLLV